MTASEVVLDTWAWWEILFETDTGARLSERYVQAPGVRVHTSALAIGELVAKLRSFEGEGHGTEGGSTAAATDLAGLEQQMVASILGFSQVHDLTAETCEAAGRLRSELRHQHPDASLADAIMLATARKLDAVLISDDGAFAGVEDVRSD